MAWAQAKQNVDIGIVIDGVIEGAAENLTILKGELSSLLGSKYNVRIAADNVLNAGWSADNAWRVLKTAPISDAGLTATMAKNNTTYKTLPIDRGIDDVLNNLDDIDAVYLGQLGKFEGAKKN